jgi:hypothetical protein
MTAAPTGIVSLGPVSGPRHASFAAACERFGLRARMIGWDAFLADPAVLKAALYPGAYLRFDTPDQDIPAIAALYRAGETAAREQGIETVPQGSEARLARGDIGSPAQLAFGLAAAMDIASRIARPRGAILSTNAEEVACSFDKTATLARLRDAAIPVPPCLPAVTSFDALTDAMAALPMPRTFVKLRHGSAAAGMIALARHGDQWRAVTTAEPCGDGIRASRNLRRLDSRAEIARLFDRLSPLGLHAEAWLPKIGIHGRVADVRLVMLADGTIFPVLRTSRHPMTNLHLGGTRGPVEPLISRIGTDRWEAVLASARGAARCFPASHVLGLDVAVLADGRSHALLEVNVFGDFVKEVLADGLTPHEAQVRQIAALLAGQGVAA